MVYLTLLMTGLASGFLAGLLGIGGGFVVVPVLMVLLPALGVDPELVPKVAVATSLAAMVPTACSAVYAQHRHGTLHIQWLRRLAPGAAMGAAIGSQLAAAVERPMGNHHLRRLCRLLCAENAAQPTGRSGANRSRCSRHRCAPGTACRCADRRFLRARRRRRRQPHVPYLLLAGVEMKRAVAMASAVGLAIALPGAVGYASASLGTSTLDSSLLIGLVHWPVALTLAASAVAMAPRGVAVSHALPVQQLKRAFGAVLLVICAVTLTRTVDVIEGVDQVVDLATVKLH